MVSVRAETGAGPTPQVSAVPPSSSSSPRQERPGLLSSSVPRLTVLGQEESRGQPVCRGGPQVWTGSQGQARWSVKGSGAEGPGGECELQGPRPEQSSCPASSTIASGAPSCVKALIGWPKAVWEQCLQQGLPVWKEGSGKCGRSSIRGEGTLETVSSSGSQSGSLDCHQQRLSDT